MNVVTVMIVNPMIANHFAPYLSNKRPVTSDITPVMIAPGNNSKPEINAEYPLASCIYIGINKDGPIKDTIEKTPMIVVNVNVLYLNTLIFNNGVSNFNCLNTKITNVTIPTTNVTITIGDVNPSDLRY